MIRYASFQDATQAVLNWGGKPNTINHIGDHGNSIFSFVNNSGNQQILRMTDPMFRSYNEVVAELEFVNHLKQSGVSVAMSVPTNEEQLAILKSCATGEFICSSVVVAEGVEVKEDSLHWGPKFFQEWGRNLGLIHKFSKTHQKKSMGYDRWLWHKEILIDIAKELIPKDDRKSLEEFEEVFALCHSLPINENNFGMIHADHAPQNFRYDFLQNKITAFDFGNCCYHWFIADLAISLSTVRRKSNRELIKENILTGYSSIMPLPPNYSELIDLFIRLRVLYVYLSRLHMWSLKRTQQQQKDLDLFKEMVHLKRGW